MIPLEYIRTDRNGTKYYADWTCPRCGGAGQSDNWLATGRTCWGCGGTGRRLKPRIVKIYTPGHEAKLGARRAAREAKRLAENPPPSEDEVRARAEQARRNIWKSEGFAEDGTGYLHTGDTYENRMAFLNARGRWNRFLRGYVVPKVIELKGVRAIEIHAQDFCNAYGYIDMDKALEFAEGSR